MQIYIKPFNDRKWVFVPNENIVVEIKLIYFNVSGSGITIDSGSAI